MGAYTGVLTLATLAAHPRLRAHAFDMVPPVVAVLEENVARNGFRDRAEVHLHAVGDPELTARMPSVDSGSALPSFLSTAMTFDDGQTVGSRALDDFTEAVEGPVVMKIDVEGGEVDVLSHGREFLAAHRPDMLCEVLAEADGPAIESLLEPHGYRFYQVGTDGLRERPRIEPDPSVRDWLFSTRTPEDLDALGIPVRG
ncbi:FkbM family methyltransferase [Brevibacterium litoralis]|uniref:FkbM family methyltransferase n=1 Tax=Brevibacterium litoralis TaxID=3138935 RepID=UPI0032EAC436